jgi:signal transduction histidine kinase
MDRVCRRSDHPHAMTNTTTVLRVALDATTREAASAALRGAGFGVVEAESWESAAQALQRGEAQLLVCDAHAAAGLAPGAQGLTRDAARALSHDLRTPLSAMAGWLHLIESGRLDGAGLQRAIDKLRGNIDDQVKTIERHLGANKDEGTR